MDNSPSVLLTNDDGIGATGIEAIEQAVSEVADVTVVAPATNQSGVSRADSQVFDVEKRESGYVVQGTPADCVQFGVGWLETTFDMVISGCNDGPNLGEISVTPLCVGNRTPDLSTVESLGDRFHRAVDRDH